MGVIPKIKKKIGSFIMNEEGSISKKNLFTLGTFVGSAAISSVIQAKMVEADVWSWSVTTSGATASHAHHASHSSHGSHGSHSSHSSHGSHSSHSSHGSHGSHSSHGNHSSHGSCCNPGFVQK